MSSCLEEFRLVEEMGQWPQRVTQRVRNPHGILVGQSGCRRRLLEEAYGQTGFMLGAHKGSAAAGGLAIV